MGRIVFERFTFLEFRPIGNESAEPFKVPLKAVKRTICGFINYYVFIKSVRNIQLFIVLSK